MIEFFESLLAGYSAVYFSRKRGAGVLFLTATMLAPAQGLAGLACAAAAILIARAAGFDRARIRSGAFGVNALLVGLALASRIPPSPALVVALALAAALTVLLTAGLQPILEGVFGLPQMSLAFVLATLILSALPVAALPDALAWEPDFAPPGFLGRYLGALSAVFFSVDPQAGLLVFVGLLYSSRIALTLSVLGFGAAAALGAVTGAVSPESMPLFAGFNSSICAIAVGGIYCVPSPASYLLAAVCAVLCLPLTLWADVLLASFCGSSLALPFLALVCLAIAALRTRPVNAGPELVQLPGSPEENLAIAHFRRMRRRQTDSSWLRLPFLGTWRVTQGANGELTHQGPWRHAVDFSLPPAGDPAAADSLSAYPAFGLPALAPQRGTVAAVAADRPDNVGGAMDTERNWGNYVSLRHVDGSYSLLAHLKKDSIRVRPGDPADAGQVLGLCGNSGRSQVPHLHYHVQRAAEPGGETLPFTFARYIRGGDEPRLVERAFPTLGESVRNIVPSAQMRAAFAFVTGTAFRFEVTADGVKRTETLTAGIELDGSRYLESDWDRARLYYFSTDEMFYFAYCSARPGSLLFALLLAASDVPLAEEKALAWEDELPLSVALEGPLRFSAEFALPFFPCHGLRLRRRFLRPAEGEPKGPIELRTEIDAKFPASLRGAAAAAAFSPESGPLRVELEGPGRLLAVRVDS